MIKLKLKNIEIWLILGTFIFLLSAYSPPNNFFTNWTAPKSADGIKNPLKGNLESAKEGKKLFTQLCVPCHGTRGKGDGVAGMSLNPRPTNLTLEIVQNQSDGAIFWKITEGNPPMASYKAVLPDTDRWKLVNYIRSLK